LDFDYASEWLIVKLDASPRTIRKCRLAAGLLLIHHESATAPPGRGLDPRDMARKNNDLNRICRKYRHAKSQ
jgi:hypothetical protein